LGGEVIMTDPLVSQRLAAVIAAPFYALFFPYGLVAHMAIGTYFYVGSLRSGQLEKLFGSSDSLLRSRITRQSVVLAVLWFVGGATLGRILYASNSTAPAESLLKFTRWTSSLPIFNTRLGEQAAALHQREGPVAEFMFLVAALALPSLPVLLALALPLPVINFAAGVHAQLQEPQNTGRARQLDDLPNRSLFGFAFRGRMRLVTFAFLGTLSIIAVGLDYFSPLDVLSDGGMLHLDPFYEFTWLPLGIWPVRFAGFLALCATVHWSLMGLVCRSYLLPDSVVQFYCAIDEKLPKK
jgi:hypothetical protein